MAITKEAALALEKEFICQVLQSKSTSWGLQ